jgi:hypothetical protein
MGRLTFAGATGAPGADEAPRPRSTHAATPRTPEPQFMNPRSDATPRPPTRGGDETFAAACTTCHSSPSARRDPSYARQACVTCHAWPGAGSRSKLCTPGTVRTRRTPPAPWGGEAAAIVDRGSPAHPRREPTGRQAGTGIRSRPPQSRSAHTATRTILPPRANRASAGTPERARGRRAGPNHRRSTPGSPACASGFRGSPPRQPSSAAPSAPSRASARSAPRPA